MNEILKYGKFSLEYQKPLFNHVDQNNGEKLSKPSFDKIFDRFFLFINNVGQHYFPF